MRRRYAKLGDYLDANDVWRRELRLQIDTPELLRTTTKRRQRPRQQRLLYDARAQLREQMREVRRRAFRGEVSVELQIYTAGPGVPPGAPKSVKRYLDALTGIVYGDDVQVGHLLVRRFAPDHPYARKAEKAGVHVPKQTRDAPAVYLTVTPLRLYVANYDRAFAWSDELTSGRTRWGIDRDGGRFFEERFGDREDEGLDDLLEERRDDQLGRGIYGIDNPELAASMRRFREDRIADFTNRMVLDQRPGRYDRPGPDASQRDVQVLAKLGLEPTEAWRRLELPGTLRLPLPLESPRAEGESSWEKLIHDHMKDHRSKWARMLADFDIPLALDIAINRAARNARDIDNVAHAVLSAFEDLYCTSRGTVVSYRAYRCAAGEPGVRVHVMAAERLEQLDAAIATARELVLRRGPRRSLWD